VASIRERKNKDGSIHFQVQIRLKGHPPEVGYFKRKTDAQKWAQKTEVEILEGRYFKTSESKKRTLGDLIDKYMQVKLPARGRDKETVGPQLEWWKQTLGAYTLANITPQMITEQKDTLLSQPKRKKGEKEGHMLSNATVTRYLASLSVCFTYGVRDLGWINDNPLKDVSKPKASRGRVRFLSAEERESLLKACKDSPSKALYPVVVIALATGARLSEITHLRWQDIDLQKAVIRLEETKNGERRSVPLATPALRIFQDLNKVRRIDTDLVFARADGKEPVDLRKTFARTAEKAGLKDFRFHDLRHTAASYLAMSGASMLEIAEILGHKTLTMVKRYAHLSEKHTAGVLERMNAKQFAPCGSMEKTAESVAIK
jgi:integrase